MTNINIDDRHINEILSEVGYPVLTLEDIEISVDQLKEIVIIPVLREFYSWFPITTFNEYSVTSTFAIDFPETNIFGILDARINTNSLGGGAVTSNPFINEQFAYNRIRKQRYGTRYDYNLEIADIMVRAQRESELNSIIGKRIDVSIMNRQVTGYTNVVGRLLIEWAHWDENFENIQYTKQDEVIKLCKARLLRVMAMIRGQQNSDTPVQFDAALFLDRAKELEEEVKEKWKDYSKVVVRRM